MEPLEQLTKRQRNVYDFIREKIRGRGYGPTVREIGEKMDMPVVYISAEGMQRAFSQAGLPPSSLCTYCIGGNHPFQGWDGKARAKAPSPATAALAGRRPARAPVATRINPAGSRRARIADWEVNASNCELFIHR